MARRVYKPDQKAALQILADIHSEHIAKKAVLRQEIAQAFENKMVDLELKKSRAMNVALSVGVAKTDIGRTIGTTNFETIKKLLERTAGDVELEDLIPKIIRYTFVPADEDQSIWWDSIRVHMDGAEYEAWKAGEGKKRFRVNGNAAGIDAGVFQITADGGPGIRTYESFDRSTPNTFDTAVGGWLQGPGRAEVRAWIAGNTPERIVVEEETEE